MQHDFMGQASIPTQRDVTKEPMSAGGGSRKRRLVPKTEPEFINPKY